ncbi:AraC family transcriptional regulator [Pseudomonas sp. PDM15]|jgi:AraC-like DNA-binding protein|uniref:AraC family transcriptional regulator n=1 Tax=Pseudomonas sp. PDM15 TaxID=2769303 RepID=UPI0017800F9C|nr:AraC family transcriptional regulator [Pseudomonas sp. PDM15]MBD9426175.1 AraC family transcriptional regulator [Pseudomonas sp. PDM15]
MTEPSTLASWTRALRRQLDALGLDSAALCREAGLDPALLDDANARYPLHATTRLWQLAVAASGDPTLGLHTSRHVAPTTFHALGMAVMASGTLREVFERIVRYHQVVSDALELELRETDEVCELHLRLPPGSPAPAPEAIDAFAAIYVRTCRNRLGRDYAPLAVHLRRPLPIDPRPWQEVFRAPVHFAASEDVLCFARADLDRPLGDGNPELAAHNEAVLRKRLEALQPDTVARRLRRALEQCLPNGEPSAEALAHGLHLSLRSLQRHLSDEGSSYEQVLADTRRDLALDHLREADCSISEVAYLLGFADSSSFSRAFKRWTGQSPSQYRDSLQG